MRVTIVGGIFGRPSEYRDSISQTPEALLLAGLLERGVDARGAPHAWIPEPQRQDIVHVHHLAKGALGYGVTRHLVARRLVFTCHGMELNLPKSRQAALEFILSRADAVVALSQAEKRALQTRIPQRPVAVIPNGIALPAPRRRARPAEDQAGAVWQLLFVGQLIPLKNVDILLRALAELQREVDIRLRLVYHNAYCEQELQALASRLQVTDRVAFVGRCGPDALAEEYARAHALVLPSSTEALPSVVTESLASACPVVGSTVGGIPEQLGQSGLLVPPGDVDALAGALRRLIRDYADYLRKAEARAVEVREEFAVNRMIDRHLRLYETMLSRSRHAAQPLFYSTIIGLNARYRT